MKSSIDFVKADTKNAFIKMAVPMVAAMFLNMVYNMMDSIWVGNLLGENAMAALTSATPIILLLNAVGMGATNGLSILLSQKIGAGDPKKVRSLITTSFVSAVLFALVLTIALELGLPTILHGMQTRPELFDMADHYLKVYLIGYISTFLYLYFAALLRSYGNTSLQAVSLFICTVINGVLNPILIHWIGFDGSAVATVISQSISVVILLVYLVRKKLFSLQFSALRFQLLAPILKNALPAVIQQSIPAVSTSFLTAVISGFTVTAVAGYGIIGKLEIIPFYPAMAFNMILTTIIGQCVGAKRFDRAKEYIKYALRYGTVVVLILSALIIFFSKQLSFLFVQAAGVSKLVRDYFIIVGVGYVLNMVTNCLLGAVNGMGKPAVGMLLMVFYYVIVRMPLAWGLSKTFFGLQGVWIAVLISHVVACLSAVLYYIAFQRKDTQPIDETVGYKKD